MYLCGLILYTFFYLNAKEPKHQGLETPTKLSLYFLKFQKLVPLLSHPNSDSWYFLTKIIQQFLTSAFPWPITQRFHLKVKIISTIQILRQLNP